MPAISSLAKAIDCPSRFLFEIINDSIRKGKKNIIPPKENQYSLEEITMGVIFESVIQHIMTSDNQEFGKKCDEIIDWLQVIEDTGKKTSLNDLTPLPWDKKWIIRPSLLTTTLSGSQWYKIRKGVQRWKVSPHPWLEDDVKWGREKEVEAEITLRGTNGDFSLKAWGRIDLYGRGKENDYVVELKMTKNKSINNARAQAALYVKVMQSANPSDEVDGYVFHSKKTIQNPFLAEDWVNLIERGKNGEVQPRLFNCNVCLNDNCRERYSDGK